MRVLNKAADKAWAAVKRSPNGKPTGKIAKVQMDMNAHDVLDGIMRDKAQAAPGSIHELANRVMLPKGYTFIHDRHVHCEVEVVKI